MGFVGEQLIGPEELILELFHASVKIHPPFQSTERRGRTIVSRELENRSDLTFILEEEGEGTQTRRIELRPNSMVIQRIPADGEQRYRLVNCWIGSREHPVVQFD